MTTPGPTDPKPTPPQPPLGMNPPQPAPAAPPALTPPAPAPAPTGTPAPTPPATTPSTGSAAPPAVPPRAPAPTPANTPKASSAAGAYVVAVFALIIAVAAGAAAAYAVKTAWDVRDGASPAALADTTTPAGTQPAATSSAATSPTPQRTTAEPTPTGPIYEKQFDHASLQVPAPSGCLPAYVDVDSATTGSDQGHEFYLTACQDGALQVRIDHTSGRAVITEPNPSAQACAAKVAGTGTAELVLPAEAGVTFCLLTNRAQANANGLPQRLAIVMIESISATNRVTLRLSTFTIVEP